MKGETFSLENTQVILNQETIIILDEAPSRRKNLIITSLIWLFFGVFNVISFGNSGNHFILWCGITITLFHSVLLIVMMRRSTRSEIALSEIKRVKFSDNMLGEESMILYLRNGLKRKVSAIAPVSNELRAYFEGKGLEVE